MSQREVRARDADRDAAIEIVEAAWADGQLARQEYEQRTDRLLRARELRDLEREISDLQPEGTQWRPPQSATPTAAETPRTRRPLIAVAAAGGVIVAGLLTYWLRGSGETPPPPSDTAQPVSTSLLTPASFTLARKELASRTGADAVYSAALSDDKMEFLHPTSSAGTDAVEVTWDGQWGPDRPATGTGERLSLGLVNAMSVASIVTAAREQAGPDAAVTLLFQIERRGDRRICITATAADSTWSRSYDCQGRELED